MSSLVGKVLGHFNPPHFKGFRKRIKKACKKLTSALRKSKKRAHRQKQFTSVSVQTSFESFTQILSHEGELDMSHHNSSQNNSYSTARPKLTSQGRSPSHTLLPSKPGNPSSSHKTVSKSTSTSTFGSVEHSRSLSRTSGFSLPTKLANTSTSILTHNDRGSSSSSHPSPSHIVSARTSTLGRVSPAHNRETPPPSRRSRGESYSGNRITRFNDRPSHDTSGLVPLSPRNRRRVLKQQNSTSFSGDQSLQPLTSRHRSSSLSSLTSKLSNTNLSENTDAGNHLGNNNSSSSRSRGLTLTRAEVSPGTSTQTPSVRGNLVCSKDTEISDQISPSRTKDRSDSPNSFFAKLLRCLRSKSKGIQTTPVGIERILKTGGIVGLRNLGNTCFMNSALQCLSHTLELTQEYLRSDSLLERKPLGAAYAKLMQDIWFKSSSSTGITQSISPHALKTALSRVHSMFAGYGQQDSQELLRLLVSELHEEYRSLIKKRSITLVSIPRPSIDIGDERWESYFRNEDTPVSRVFMGQLRSTLICETCHGVSTTFDPFWDLPLPIPNKARGYGSSYSVNNDLTLEDCIGYFSKEEILDGSNKAYCNSCRVLRRTRKQLTINRFPPVLVMYLQRFSSQSYRNKLTTVVNIPTSLDLTRFASRESVENKYAGRKLKYELYATSNHIGSVSFGHYTALAKHYATDQWWLFNDSCATKVNNVERHLNTSEPYMMLYRRTFH